MASLEPCKHDAAIGGLEKELKAVQKEQEYLKDVIGEIRTDIKAINSKWGERPTWAVLAIITFLSSLTVGMIVYVLNEGSSIDPTVITGVF